MQTPGAKGKGRKPRLTCEDRSLQFDKCKFRARANRVQIRKAWVFAAKNIEMSSTFQAGWLEWCMGVWKA